MAENNIQNEINLSVVVPVYNVGEFLARCLDSLISTEGISENEIIIVDDGSFDGSSEIADLYAGRYGFISCYHKENGGLSDARNYGLSRAKGKYVFFCDSDDMVIPEGLIRVIEAAPESDADVILWDGISIDENDEITSSGLDVILTHSGLQPNVVMTGKEAMTNQITDHNMAAMTAWLRACRREFLLQNNLFFEKGRFHEDELWTPMVFLSAEKVIYFKEKVYCYRIRKDSIMSASFKSTEKHAEDFVFILNTVYDKYLENIKDTNQLKAVLGSWADTYLWAIYVYKIHKYECSKNIPKKKIFSSAGRFKAKIKSLILLLFGAKAYCRLI